MSVRRLHVLLASLAIISSLALVPASFVRAQNGGATKKVSVSFPKAPPTGPPAIVTGATMPIKISITDEKVTQVDILVSSIARPGLTYTLPLTRQQADRALHFEIIPWPGVNSIKLFAVRGEVADTKPSDEIRVQCDPPFCGADRKIPSPGETTGPPKGNVQTSGGKPSAVKIVKPEGGEAVTDVKSVDRTIVIDKKANVGTVMIDVLNSDKSIDHQIIKKFDETDTVGVKTVTLKLAKGENTISVYSLDHLGEPGFQDSLKITCTGPKCAAPGEKLVADADEDQKPKGSVTIVTPENKATYTDSKPVPFNVTVARKEDASKNIKKLLVTVLNEGKPIIQQEEPFAVTYPEDASKPGVISLKALKIGKGENKVEVFDPDNRKTDRAEVTIACKGDCGGKAEAKDKLSVAISAPKEGDTYKVKNVSSLDSLVTVPKGEIKDLQYDVYGPSNKSFRSEKIPVPVPADANAKTVDVPARLEFFGGLNTIRIYDAAKGGGDNDVSVMVHCDGDGCASALGITHFATPFTRGIIGLEQAAAASSNPEQKLFLEFNLTAPLFRKGRSPLEAPLWLWLNPRITSVPQQNASSVAQFATASNFFSQFTTGQVNEIAQGFKFTGGFEIPLKHPKDRVYVTGPIASGFGPNTKVRFGVSLLFGGGIVTPFNSQNPKLVQVFDVNDSIKERFPEVGTNTKIAFVSGDRTRFYRQYFGGLRLKTYYVKGDDPDDLDNIFPGILDVTFGQNEAVTRACLCGVVTHIEGIFPLPFIKGDKRGSVYVFGSASMKLNDAKVLPPVFLVPTNPPPQVPGAGIFIKQIPPEDRDHYRLGVGVDLIRLFKRD